MVAGAKIVLHLVPLPAVPGEPPPMIRLRQILKRLLRSHGWRCTAVLLEGQDRAEVFEDAGQAAEEKPACPG